MKVLAFQRADFENPPAPKNRIICLTHAIPGDDGGGAIWEYLNQSFFPLTRLDRHVLEGRTGRTFVVDVPYGQTIATVAARYGIPARYMTTPVLVLPMANGMYELDTMGLIQRAVDTEAPVAFALGDVSVFSPIDRDVSDVDALSSTVLSLINYVESHYFRPVVYVATGPYGPVIARTE